MYTPTGPGRSPEANWYWSPALEISNSWCCSKCISEFISAQAHYLSSMSSVNLCLWYFRSCVSVTLRCIFYRRVWSFNISNIYNCAISGSSSVWYGGAPMEPQLCILECSFLNKRQWAFVLFCFVFLQSSNSSQLQTSLSQYEDWDKR